MKKLFSALFVLVILSSTVFAQSISVGELAKLLNNENVVIIDARAASDYAKTHIKGSVNLDVKTLSSKTPIEGILKSKTSLASTFGKIGVSNAKTVVIYCKTGVRAGRMYWILKYLGHKNVKILNGHMAAWVKGRKPITNAKTTPKAATFTPAINSKIKVDKAYVKSKMNTALLIDTRKKEDYDKGHIGKAINIPHKTLLVGEKLKSTAALTTLLNAAGVSKSKEIILYCKTSTTASLVYFILKSQLKYTNVKVYDGAYLEWTN